MKLANGQDIDYVEKKWPQSFICPFTGAIFHNIQTCLLVYIQQISGEHLHDHWSSGWHFNFFEQDIFQSQLS